MRAYTIGEESLLLREGDFINSPSGCAYSFRNHGSLPVRFLAILAPAGLEEFVATVGYRVSAGASSAEATPERIAQMVSRATDYGVTYQRL